MRLKGDDGRANHAEIALADGAVMLGSPGDDYKNPKRLGAVTQLIHVYVDGIDRHCEAAKAAGARIVRPPEDQFYGDRRYDAEDPEGHMWSFAEHIRDGLDEMQQGYEMRAGIGAQAAAGFCCTAQALPSGSAKKTNEFQSPPGPSMRTPSSKC